MRVAIHYGIAVVAVFVIAILLYLQAVIGVYILGWVVGLIAGIG